MCRVVAGLIGLSLSICLIQGSTREWIEKVGGKETGFMLTLPDNNLFAGPGSEMHTKNGEFRVIALGGLLNGEKGDSLAKRWRDELESLENTVTYKRKTPKWYVISGTTKEGSEYYHKLYTKGPKFAEFRITYPHSKDKTYGPWVVRIEKTFIPFVKEEFDHTGRWLEYGQSVTFTGKIVTQHHAEWLYLLGNTKEARERAQGVAYILQLDQPFSVRGDAVREVDQELNVSEIDLFLVDQSARKVAESLVKKHVSVSGKLDHANTVHHLRPVTMDVSEIR